MQNFFLIIFIGRPYELKRIINDKGFYIENQIDCDSIIKAHNIYYGFQYLGFLASIPLVFRSSRIAAKYKMKKKFCMFFISLTPAAIGFILSHFVYWHFIREIIIKSRKFNKNFSEFANKHEIDEIKLIQQSSIDYHDYILKNIGYMNCIKYSIKHIAGLIGTLNN